MRDQLGELAHDVESEETRAQIVYVLQECDPVGTLMHVSGNKSVLDDVKKLNGLCLCHTLVEVRD